MLHICMIVHQYYHADSRVRRYAEALADAGVHVDVLCLRDKSGMLVKVRQGIRIFTIPLERKRKGRGHYLIEYGSALILFTIWLLGLYLKNRYSIIHIHNMPDFLIFTALFPKLLGAKLILDIHDPMPEFYVSKFGNYRDRVGHRLLQVQEKLSIGLAHKVITANSNFKQNLMSRRVHASKIAVINNVADPKIFSRKHYQKTDLIAKTNFTLVYPGTIAPRYGLDIPIRALPILVKHIPQIRLSLVGAHVSYLSELLKLAASLNVLHLVQYKPLLPVEEVPHLLLQADVGIYPALPDPHMSIAMPSKVLEYIAIGIPIVASRLKVLEDSFPKSAVMLFEPGNVEEFSDIILELYNNPTKQKELTQNAESIYIKTYNWSSECQKYFELLRQLTPGILTFNHKRRYT